MTWSADAAPMFFPVAPAALRPREASQAGSPLAPPPPSTPVPRSRPHGGGCGRFTSSRSPSTASWCWAETLSSPTTGDWQGALHHRRRRVDAVAAVVQFVRLDLDPRRGNRHPATAGLYVPFATRWTTKGLSLAPDGRPWRTLFRVGGRPQPQPQRDASIHERDRRGLARAYRRETVLM